MARYKKELTLPSYPISLDEIYDRAEKISQRILRRPIFSVEEDDDEILPLGGDHHFSRTAGGLAPRSRFTEKRMSVAVSHRHVTRSSHRDRRRSVAPDFQSKRRSISPSLREFEEDLSAINGGVGLSSELPSDLLKRLPNGR